LLEELGFDEGLITPLRENYLDPIARVLYAKDLLLEGQRLDSHKAFVVQYQTGHKGRFISITPVSGTPSVCEETSVDLQTVPFINIDLELSDRRIYTNLTCMVMNPTCNQTALS